MPNFAGKLASVLLLICLTLGGCDDQKKVSGQIFIATNGGENVKLGAVRVAAYDSAALENWAGQEVIAMGETRGRTHVWGSWHIGAVSSFKAEEWDEIERLQQIDSKIVENMPPPLASTVTDADGRFELPAQPGQVLIAYAERLAPAGRERFFWAEPVQGNTLLLTNSNTLHDAEDFLNVLWLPNTRKDVREREARMAAK